MYASSKGSIEIDFSRFAVVGFRDIILRIYRISIMGRIQFSVITLVFALSCFKGYSQYPEGFQIEVVVDNVEYPAGLTHSDLGVSYAWDLQGIIWPIIDGVRAENPLLDIHDEVGFWNDHGLLSVEIDPDFEQNGYIYLLYCVDRHHLLHYGTPDYDPEVNEYEAATIGRITRYQVNLDDLTSLVDGSRTILIGEGAEDGLPIATTSHGVGQIIFGSDKTLIFTMGDSNPPHSIYNGEGDPPSDTGYEQQALDEGILKAHENVGAFRSQLLNSYCGKILRIDKNTGQGVSSNPFFDPDRPDEPISKVWSLGLRNPFRLTLTPNTGSTDPEDGMPGEFILGDVGDWSWEEVNRVNTSGQNFGWPIYQGPSAYYRFVNIFAKDITRPIQDDCSQEYYFFHDVIVDPRPDHNEIWEHPCGGFISPEDEILFVHELPVLSYRNWIDAPPELTAISGFDENGNVNYTSITELGIDGALDFAGSASVGGVFYRGGAFPAEYYNAYFHADFDQWLKVFHFDEFGNISKMEHWDDDIGNIVHISYNPNDESVYVATIFPGEIKRISFEGNLRPIASFSPDTTFGNGAINVEFDASDTYDPEGTDLTYEWSFGDDSDGSGVNVSHLFEPDGLGPQSFEVTLTVTDQEGKSNQARGIVSLNNTPPEATITGFQDGDLYSIYSSSTFNLDADIADAESANSELDIRWRVFLHHNTHFHLEATHETESATATIEPLGCGIETYWYRVELTVTDPHGLQVITESEIFPDCDSELSFAPEFSIYPNPVTTRLNLRFSSPPGDWVEITTFDSKGKKVDESRSYVLENQTNQIEYDVSGYAAGGYILKCKSAAGWVETERFVVVKSE